MRKVFLVIFVILIALATGACSRDMMIYNGCNGSWVRVHDGRGNLLVDRLDYGLETTVDVRGYSGSIVEFLAAGFELRTNRPLGSATTSRHIPYSGGGSAMGPSQIPPWEIIYLYTTDQNGGCH